MLEKFTFYDLYYKALKDETDEIAGRTIKNICKVMFTEEQISPPQDEKERFEWENLLLTLNTVKAIETAGKQPRTLNKKMKRFTFYMSYYSAIKLLGDSDAGAYIKALCEYVFNGKEPKNLSPVVDKYFGYAKWNITISKMRISAGRKGGKATPEKEVITLDKIKTEFGLWGDILNHEYLKDVDLDDAYKYFKTHPDCRRKSLFVAMKEYLQSKANGF